MSAAHQHESTELGMWRAGATDAAMVDARTHASTRCTAGRARGVDRAGRNRTQQDATARCVSHAQLAPCRPRPGPGHFAVLHALPRERRTLVARASRART